MSGILTPCLKLNDFLAKYDKHCKIKMAEIRLIETSETVEIWYFDIDAPLGQLVFKEVVK